jgi:hypothetical protein
VFGCRVLAVGESGSFSLTVHAGMVARQLRIRETVRSPSLHGREAILTPML